MAKFVAEWADQGDGKSHHRPAIGRALARCEVGQEDQQPQLEGRLRKLHGANVGRARNVVLTTAQIRTLVTLAYGKSAEFGRFVETAAETGARRSQLARLTVVDLQDARPDPRLQMPGALKGRRGKRIERHRDPIPAGLAATLRRAAGTSVGDAPLLTKSDGSTWQASNPRLPFRKIVAQAKLDPDVVTRHAFRHSSITRQLVAGIPVRVVAYVQHLHRNDRSLIQLFNRPPLGCVRPRLAAQSWRCPVNNVVPMPVRG